MKILKVFFAAILICVFTFSGVSTQAEISCNHPSVMLDDCPAPSFSIVNNGVTAGTPVSFVNQSTGATSYLWDFGDGTNSTAANLSHVYGAAGNYTVKLRAMFDGCAVEFIGSQDVVVF